MDTAGYSKWDGRLEEVPGGHLGRWGRRPLFLVLALVVITVLWALILSVLFSKASTERGALLDLQEGLSANGLRTQAQLQTVSKELTEARSKLLQQESALKELSERVTQNLAEAGRDRENIRTELFRALEQARLGNSSCKECPESWLPFQGSCYFFSTLRATWVEAQQHCERSGAHLVIVGGLEEQGFLSRNTRGRGYWLGLRAVRKVRRIQGYQWVDGVALSFSHWNRGEPNDSMGREDCIMMLRTGMWNDAPCDNENDNWICEKRLSC
ncbi:C-type lectin domain family 4 member G isoform X2 [Bubalus bubalis]|uniref:C-type lectin domain family 4 member G isoform X2 n=1 Tax=Bubalus bubalis TaxID=89462 RepID=UPI001E1B8F6D|nr:C-type lectin domain family 4 member G isoform X2 [Bubalus bubalis]